MENAVYTIQFMAVSQNFPLLFTDLRLPLELYLKGLCHEIEIKYFDKNEYVRRP
jgi:hypothetical protein